MEAEGGWGAFPAWGRLGGVPAHNQVQREPEHTTSLQLLVTTPLVMAPSVANLGKPHHPSTLLSPAHAFVNSCFIKRS